MYKIKRFFKKIVRVLEFIKLGWQDEDWDFDYMLELIKFKCEKMRKYLTSSSILHDSYKREIRIGLNKTLYYIDCYRDPHILYEAKYGEEPIKVTDNLNILKFRE